MRTPLVLVTLIVATAILGPLVVVAKLFRVKERRGSVYEWAMRTWARSLNAAAGARVHVHGAEHLQGDTGAVYIANHVSWFDIFALASVVPRCTFIAKSELRKIPVFGWAAESAGIVFIDRENRKSAFESYKSATAQIERGRSVVVCPEGTRGYDYHLRPFKKGPFVLAIAAQAPIVPTVVYGAREVMGKGSFRVRSHDIDLHFLPLVSTVGCDYDHRGELMQQVWQQIADTMRDLYGVGTSERPIAADAKERAG